MAERAECSKCGAALSAELAQCPSCGADVFDVSDSLVLKPRLSDSDLNVLAKAATAEIPLGATHRYQVAERFELPRGFRPLSAVIEDQDFLVLGFAQQHVVVQRVGAQQVVASIEQGEGDDQMGDPAGIALDDAGNVFLLDARNCRVIKLDPTGRIVDRYGSDGLGPGQLAYPRDLEVLGDGTMVIADTSNNRIQMWDREGNHVMTIGPQIDEDVDTEVPAGQEVGQFDGPMGVTADAMGHLYVADTNNHRIQIFLRDGSFHRAFGSEGTGAGLLLFPTDVRVAESGDVFVFDLHSRRIQKFDATGVLQYGLMLNDAGPHSVVGAIGDIDVAPDETIYIPVPSEGAVLRCRRVEG